MTHDSAIRDLWRRYRQSWAAAWMRRQSMQAPARLPHEHEFMPAALALQDTPVHPAPRYISRAILLFAVLALLWACIGKIDVVASASGKIVPSGRSKTLQASETAVVKAIHVRDGQAVRAGQVLVELDSISTDADVDRLSSDRLAAQIDVARASAMLTAIDLQRPPTWIAESVSHAPINQQQAAQAWLQGQYLELRSSLDQADADIEQRTAQIHSVHATVTALRQTLPITRRLADDYRQLHASQYVPRHALLEKQQALLDQERELAQQLARIPELEAGRKKARHRRKSVVAQSRRAQLDLQHGAAQKVTALGAELQKAERRDQLMNLTAPVAGTVQQLAIHTQGGVVTAAQPLLVIVPADQPLEVEAFLENKDIGFVRPGQDVEIKVETFTFTKYGVVAGRVLSISHDAIEDERRGLLYSMRVELLRKDIQVGAERVALSPGMAVRAEIRTDKRRVIDYFLSPLKAYGMESLNER